MRDFPESRITLSDVDPRYVALLGELFKSKSNVSVSRLDLADSADFKLLRYKPDSVLALNVLEHVKDDVSALNNAYDILENNGRFILLVPAHKALYNSIDTAIGHFRGYDVKNLTTTVSKTRFRVQGMFYINFMGIPGWYLSGTLLHRPIVDAAALHFYDKLVPTLRSFEKRLLKGKLGISLIAVLEKR